MARLSLCVIARDEERNLPSCLSFAKPWVDEMIVVDTGSSDRTVEVARSHGAQVFDFPWIDDFAAARNAALSHAMAPWTLSLDADEVIGPEDGQALRRLVESDGDGLTLGYYFTVASADGRGDHLRLVRNGWGLHYERRCHEDILNPILRAGGRVAYSELTVRHSGRDDLKLIATKAARNRRLLEMDLLDRPGDPKTLYELARECFTIGCLEETADYARSAIAADQEEFSWRRDAAMLTLADALIQSGRHGEAEEVLREALRVKPGDPRLLRARGLLAFCRSWFWDAGMDYLMALAGGLVGIEAEVAKDGLQTIRSNFGEFFWHRLLEKHRDSLRTRSAQPVRL